jgi:hypothetical protein
MPGCGTQTSLALLLHTMGSETIELSSIMLVVQTAVAVLRRSSFLMLHRYQYRQLTHTIENDPGLRIHTTITRLPVITGYLAWVTSSLLFALLKEPSYFQSSVRPEDVVSAASRPVHPQIRAPSYLPPVLPVHKILYISAFGRNQAQDLASRFDGF